MGKVLAHIGAFDIENYGDLLFTDVLNGQMKKRIDVDEIFYFAPNECIMPNTNRKVYCLKSLEDMHKKYNFDAIILGGGDFIHLQKVMMKFSHLGRSWELYDVLYMWVIPSLVANKYNVPLLWNCPGVPIPFSENDSNIVNILCNSADYISVRDPEAKKVLKDALEKDTINVVPDSVLSIRDIYTTDYLLNIFNNLKLGIESKKYIFFQGNSSISDDDLKICADTLKKIKEETGFEILLQTIGYALGDQEALEKIYNYYPDDFILCNHHTQFEILSLVAHAALYIGTSLHGSITSNAYEVNNIIYNVNHYNKIDGFARLMDRKQFVVYEAKDIYTTFASMGKLNKSVLENNIDHINEHFDKMAQIIEHPNKKEKKIDFVALAEYIYRSNQIEIELNRVKPFEKEYYLLNEKLERTDIALQEINKKYEEVLKSTSWKITKPIRFIISKFK